MSAGRTVTVRTLDHGDVTVPEPSWCLGRHDQDVYRSDIWHEGEEVPLLVTTPCHGRVPLLRATVVQKPFATDTAVRLAVGIDGEPHELSSHEVRGLSGELVSLGRGLEWLADRVASFEAGDAR
ncbi:DUF6907 domain-containing protein [Streptomyces sp. CCM_MD2014]|uniref:DUF6907 domain-containing protein n=1 Tax=Streptomyces sp. CCM_MD2014 TaxID=1561022 RepID=UPI00052AD3AA|nr:hypothetical protein [Streptomyces sp. CCM_MD2014]AIV35920.1 hypothetical protein NI25_22580 [Streptomyces sp. CCM_MD2014]